MDEDLTVVAERTRLVSFLGLGRYETTRHRFPDGREGAPTQYVCRALGEFVAADEVEVLATVEAEEKHGRPLLEALKGANFPAPRFHRVPKGESDAELWQQFGVVKERLRAPAGTSVVLDVTHAFRSQPFFAAAVSAFVRAVDPAPVPVRIFYGAFDPQQPELTPIWELTPFIELLNWAQAIMLFLRTGRSDGVAERTIRFGTDLARRWSETKEGPPPVLKALGIELQRFGRNLETIRTGALLFDDGEGSAAKVAQRVRDARVSAAELPPLADVLDRLECEMLTPLLGVGEHLANAEGHRALAELAKLYLGMGRWAEAAAVAREGWITLYAAPQAALLPLNQNQRGVDTRARRVAEGRWKGIEKTSARDVAEIRNDIEHAGFGAQPLPADALRGQIQELVERFETAIATAAAAPPIFLNISNHPSAGWGKAQTKAALALAAEIRDLCFPAVPPEADSERVAALADGIVNQMERAAPGATHAMVQGEFTLVHALVRRIQERGIVALAATTRREVVENSDGTSTTRFAFVRFREYS